MIIVYTLLSYSGPNRRDETKKRKIFTRLRFQEDEEAEEAAAVLGFAINRANERDVTRSHGILANSRDTMNREESLGLSWMENLFRSRVILRYSFGFSSDRDQFSRCALNNFQPV